MITIGFVRARLSVRVKHTGQRFCWWWMQNSDAGRIQMYALLCMVTHAHTYTHRWLTCSRPDSSPVLGSGPGNNYNNEKQTCLWLTLSRLATSFLHSFTLKRSVSLSLSSATSFSLFTSAFNVSLASWRWLTKPRRCRDRELNREICKERQVRKKTDTYYHHQETLVNMGDKYSAIHILQLGLHLCASGAH